MNEEIKERLEQIRRGEVPDGYKRTKAGIIPEEWKAMSLRDIASYSNAHARGERNAYVSTENMGSNYGTVSFSEKMNGPVDGIAYRKENVLIGNIRPYLKKVWRADRDGVCSADVLVLQHRGVQPLYFYHLIARDEFFCYVMGNSKGSKMPRGDKNHIMNMPVLIPVSKTEQTTIATILSAQDKIVDLKDRFITEKERQKKHLMQQLLTGKRRLPGFSGDWKLTKAREVFQNVTDKNHNGNLEVLSSTQDRGIIPRSQTDIDIKYDSSALPSYKKVKKGNFIISLRSFQGGIEYSAYEGLVSPAYTVLENKIPIDAAYYKQYFKSARYIAQLQTAVYGIRDGKQISYDDFGFIEICYPSIQEQAAIGEVLSAADQEIDLLRASLEQEKRKKKALSQLLLTGIVRV